MSFDGFFVCLRIIVHLQLPSILIWLLKPGHRFLLLEKGELAFLALLIIECHFVSLESLKGFATERANLRRLGLRLLLALAFCRNEFGQPGRCQLREDVAAVDGRHTRPDQTCAVRQVLQSRALISGGRGWQ